MDQRLTATSRQHVAIGSQLEHRVWVHGATILQASWRRQPLTKNARRFGDSGLGCHRGRRHARLQWRHGAFALSENQRLVAHAENGGTPCPVDQTMPHCAPISECFGSCSRLVLAPNASGLIYRVFRAETLVELGCAENRDESVIFAVASKPSYSLLSYTPR